jgi:polyphosphate kinase 2
VHKGLKVCVVFEGRDGAGKGGTIKAITERVSPRVFRVVALPAPTEREKSQMYLQRYMRHFPAAGEIVIFDRSWYNRAGVERVMGFCDEEQARRFLQMVPLVEKALVDSGILLIKYWLEVGAEEQTRRLTARIDDGRKIWKLSPMDLKSFDRWDEYTEARDDMLEVSDTEWAPWFVARSEDKKRVRLNVLSHILSRIPYEKVPDDDVKIELPRRKIGRYTAKDLPLKYVPERSLTSLNAVHIPAGVDDAKVRKRLLVEYGIEIGGGLGPFKGKAWRFGLMGHGSTRRNVTIALSAMEAILASEGVKVPTGAALAAAAKVYA